MMYIQKLVLLFGLSFCGIASAAPFYVAGNIATNGNSCNALSAAGGVKIGKGVGPQFRVTTFTGTCKTDDKVSFDFRHDFSVSDFIVNYGAGIETDVEFDGTDVVAFGGIHYPIAKATTIGMNVFSTVDNANDQDIFYGLGIQKIF